MGLSAAVIVTTPQRLAYVDVVKGIRMFARLQVRAPSRRPRSFLALPLSLHMLRSHSRCSVHSPASTTAA